MTTASARSTQPPTAEDSKKDDDNGGGKIGPVLPSSEVVAQLQRAGNGPMAPSTPPGNNGGKSSATNLPAGLQMTVDDPRKAPLPPDADGFTPVGKGGKQRPARARTTDDVSMASHASDKSTRSAPPSTSPHKKTHRGKRGGKRSNDGRSPQKDSGRLQKSNISTTTGTVEAGMQDSLSVHSAPSGHSNRKNPPPPPAAEVKTITLTPLEDAPLFTGEEEPSLLAMFQEHYANKASGLVMEDDDDELEAEMDRLASSPNRMSAEEIISPGLKSPPQVDRSQALSQSRQARPQPEYPSSVPFVSSDMPNQAHLRKKRHGPGCALAAIEW